MPTFAHPPMKTRSFLLSACAMLMAVCPRLAAQDEDQVTVQFVRVPGTEDDRSAVLRLADDKTMEVQLPSSSLSEAYQVPRQQRWVLGKQEQGDDGQQTFKAMGDASATAGKHQVVVVIDKGAMNDGRLQLIVMDLEPKADCFQFVNASSFEISGELGVERFGIAPGEHALLKAEASSSDEHQRRFCEVAFNFLKGKEYVRFFDGNWRLEDHTYALVIFHLEAVADKLKMTVIREFGP